MLWPFKKEFGPPPVPQRLREMLKDYPELIQRLQEGLNRVVTEPVNATPPFEVAIWTLENALGAFVADATDEFINAQTNGDPETIEQAEKKLLIMISARSSSGGMRLGLMDDLWRHFNGDKEVFK